MAEIYHCTSRHHLDGFPKETSSLRRLVAECEWYRIYWDDATDNVHILFWRKNGDSREVIVAALSRSDMADMTDSGTIDAVSFMSDLATLFHEWRMA